MNVLYSQVGQLASASTEAFHFWDGLQQAVASIPAHLEQLGGVLINPLVAKAPVHTLSQSVYGVMVQHFDGTVGAMAYLLFVLLYFPCVSTVAVMWRELGRHWACFSVIWTTGLAYGAAVFFYQCATFVRHPVFSSVWLSGIGCLFILMVISLRIYSLDRRRRYEFARN